MAPTGNHVPTGAFVVSIRSFAV